MNWLKRLFSERSQMPGWRAGVLTGVGQEVARHGFPDTPKRQSFEKPVPGGLWCLHLSFIRHHIDFDITADVAIRFDAVEEFLAANLPLESAEATSKHFTMGVELGNLSRGRYIRWTVARSGHVRKAVKGIAHAFRSIALPYFEEYSDPERALAVLSKDDELARTHSPIHLSRALRAVAMAHILGKRDLVDELVEKKKQFLLERDEFRREYLDYLVSRIEAERAEDGISGDSALTD